ncbi:MAG TPA: cation:proton antiporter [Candidatus Omnitrophica bacterium]|nr:MAG: cation:proton antiporter [Candidatus Omnitrophota bacterium]RKY34457.1 MAG: cation:proton antiporter [Candidatus Omnitrophota bacterium]RKY44406.1 MAG: cation:proton antiporter [Candidatus Omnitrophota bacterium]HEC69536.1 cation:proton antiporter [Candidatus Omnitrophota bacterium]
MGPLFFVGAVIILGFIFGKFSNRLKLPGVVGYLICGLLLGHSFFNILSPSLLERLAVFNDLALSLVAFVIGSELHLSSLRKVGKQIITIIFSESLGAFLLVGLGVYLLTKELYLALIFGALAPASAPAGTAVVLQEYRARGPLTTALYAVVGLDDGLAIIIYALVSALAKLLITHQSFSLFSFMKGPLAEILGAIFLGGVLGGGLGFFAQRIRRKEDLLAVSMGTIIVCAGLSNFLHFSLILSNLTLGMVFSNFFPFTNRRLVDTINLVVLPIYIIFFVIAGAYLKITLLKSMGLLGLIYIICRSLGLMGGSYLGALISGAEKTIRKYLGLGILSQAGVAIGLAILVSREFSSLGEAGRDLSLLVINVIAATTIVFEIVGPITTKIAIFKAGEASKKE